MKRIALFSTIIVLLIISAVQTAEPYLTRVRKRLIEESTIEDTTIGATTPSTGAFTTLSATGAITITSLIGANGGTLANAIDNRWVFAENSEELELIFGTNKVELGAGSTGVNTLDFNDVDDLEDIQEINGENSQKIDFNVNNRIELSENSENLHVIFGTNKVELGTDTAIGEVDFNDVDELTDVNSVTLENGQEIDGGVNNRIEITENSEMVAVIFGTDKIELGTNTSVGEVDFNDVDELTDVNSVTLENGQEIDGGINNRIEITENSEMVAVIFDTDKIELGTNSGVGTIDFNDVDELEDVNSVTLEQGQEIDGGIDNRIEFTENSEMFALIFGTDKLELGTNSGLVEIDFNDLDKLSDVSEIDTGTDTYLNVTTNGKDHSYYVIPISYISATEIRVTNGSGNLCVGLAAGADEIGSTEGYTQIDDAADFCRFSFPLPVDFVDTGTQADLIIQFDIDEQAAEECNIDVRLFEYGNTTAILTDTIVIANGAGRGWQSLVTNAAGIGNDADIDGDDVLMVEITSTADADDFNLYGCRLTYRVGVEATQ
jgi:hypothetical protein